MNFRRIFQVSSIQRRLGLIFLAFLGLLLVSVILTFASLETQKQDARVINLAGRQRMLLQQINGLAQSSEVNEKDETVSALLNAADTFDQTLTALCGGGSILDYTGERFELLPPSDPDLKRELNGLQQDWETYRGEIDRLVHAVDKVTNLNTATQIEEQSPRLIAQADRVVRAFEAVSTARVDQLRAFQIGFLLAGIALLSIGWWVTSISVVRPLSLLDQAAQRMGKGNLSSQVDVNGPAEVKILSETMESMRTQILASRQNLQQWAETLENRVIQRTRELEALSAVSREINSHLSIEEVLSSVTEKARVLLGGDVASLCLLDEDGKVLSLRAAAAPETAIQQSRSLASDPLVGKILYQQHDHHCAHPCGLQSQQGFCQIIAPAFRTSHLAAPLYAKGKVIGALCVGGSKPDAFRPEMISVLTQLSDAATVALENSRLYQQAEHVATLEERQRIAAEMHDGLLQTLSFLRIMVGLLEEQLQDGCSEKALATLQQIRRAEEQGEREIRRAIDSLHEDFPLDDTLQDRLAGISDDLSLTGPPVTFESQIKRPLLLSRQESEQVLRVVREAILNAQRHSQAPLIVVVLEQSGDDLLLSVQDHGVGFALGRKSEDGRAHFGLKIMQARAVRLGGSLSIQTSLGAGTMVQLRWSPAQLRPDETPSLLQKNEHAIRHISG